MHTRISLQPHLARAHCSICGGALTVHEEVQGRVCAQPSCRHTALMRGIAQRRDRAAALLKQRVHEISSAIIPTLGLTETESVAFAIVPSLSRPVVRAHQNLKAALRRHLDAIIAEAMKEIADNAASTLPAQEQPAAPQFEDEARPLRAACATCRGYCCRTGAERHAFLDTLTMRHYLAARPGLRPREVRRAYLSKIPRVSVEGSCLFHGASGCTLPRPMRSATCNNFHCLGVK